MDGESALGAFMEAWHCSLFLKVDIRAVKVEDAKEVAVWNSAFLPNEDLFRNSPVSDILITFLKNDKAIKMFLWL